MGKAMRSIGRSGTVANRADLDALCSVMAVTIEVAEQVRSEAAAALLKRALVLVRGRCPAFGKAEGDFRAC